MRAQGGSITIKVKYKSCKSIYPEDLICFFQTCQMRKKCKEDFDKYSQTYLYYVMTFLFNIDIALLFLAENKFHGGLGMKELQNSHIGRVLLPLDGTAKYWGTFNRII